MSEPELPTADPPTEFDIYELVLLRSGHPDSGINKEEIDLLQRQHLGHLMAMMAAGHSVASGPLLDQPDQSWRGLSLYRVGSLEKARQLAEADPAVRAGLFTVEVMHWYTPKGAIPFGRAD